MSLSPVASLLDYKAFQEAAEHFQPYIKFFATFDKGVSTYGNHFDTFSGMDHSSPSSFVASLSTSVRRCWKSASEAVAPIFKPITQREKLTIGSNVTRIQTKTVRPHWLRFRIGTTFEQKRQDGENDHFLRACYAQRWASPSPQRSARGANILTEQGRERYMNVISQ